MSKCWLITLLLAVCVVESSLHAETLPPRQRLEREGWSIGYSPADETIAHRLAERLQGFEKIYTESVAAHDRDLAEFSARAGVLGATAASVSALPERAPEMRRVLEQLGPALRDASVATQRTFLLRSLEIWRIPEVARRLQAGETLTGFSWDDQTRRATLRLSVAWHPNRSDGRVVADFEVPSAVPLGLEGETDETQAVGALVKHFAQWADFAKSVDASVFSMFAPLKLREVVVGECAPAADSRWIAEGVASWAWREAVMTALPADRSDRYAIVVAQLPVRRAGQPLLRLEQWPEVDDAPHRAMACQLFCNIAEHHGADAVTRLLAEFWKLPAEQRTSASFRAVYHELFQEPLELRAPWRSLGMAGSQ